MLVWLCGLASFASAEKMESLIQEALYLFEMKGEFSKAVGILEKVVSEGDSEDQEQASFYLGKIQELAGNKQSANLYYKQSLQKASETAKAYWLAERISATANHPETIQKKKLHLKFPIRKVFESNPAYIYLHNGDVYKIVNDSLLRVPTGLSNGSEILRIDNIGIWYTLSEKDSIHFKSHNNLRKAKSFALRNPKDIAFSETKALIQGDYAIALVNRKGEQEQSSDKYNECILEMYYAPTESFVMNCPDNALHFLSDENLSESSVLSHFDAIQHVLSIKDNLVFFSGGTIFCYNLQKSQEPRWKVSFNSVESIIPFAGNIAILEPSGHISLIDMTTGNLLSAVRSDADKIYTLAKGTLGLFTSEGALIVVDTLLQPLWNFNFAKPISQAPIFTDGDTYLSFDGKSLQGIDPNYYGKTPLVSTLLSQQAAILAETSQWENLNTVLDSLMKLEPGNAEAWLFKALQLENTQGKEQDRQKAWSEAVRLSVSNPQVTPLILNRYSKAIGAKFVSLLNVSPKTRYPQFFGSKKNLYTVDPAANRLICINSETGELRWTRTLSKMNNSPVIGSDDKSLAIASGFSLNIYDLSKDGKKVTVQLPGKAFNISLENEAIYISTWNGFLMKLTRPDGRLAWSRKIFSIPFLYTRDDSQIIAASLECNITHLWEGSGQIKQDAGRIQAGISQMAHTDSTVVLATTNNRIVIYDSRHPGKEPLQILMESPIASLQTFSYQESHYILVGLANQNILLYSIAGTPLWKFQGKNSIFSSPFIDEGLAWLDQGNEVVAISISDGKIARRFSTPGGAGTPFILNKTLFSASSKRLLYGFSL
jgi:outer membrane protein assembly factor BamB